MDASMGLNGNSQQPVETNINYYATYDYMGLNKNSQEPGESIANDVHNDQCATKPAQNDILPKN